MSNRVAACVCAMGATGAFALWFAGLALPDLLSHQVDPGCLTSPYGAYSPGLMGTGAFCGAISAVFGLAPIILVGDRVRGVVFLLGATSLAALVGGVLFLDLVYRTAFEFRCWNLEGESVVLEAPARTHRIALDDIQRVIVFDNDVKGWSHLVLRSRTDGDCWSVRVPSSEGSAVVEAQQALEAELQLGERQPLAPR